MIRKIKTLAILALAISMMPVSSISGYADEGPAIISVDKVTAAPGNSISVPIRLNNNTGICGATISIKYDAGLTLTAITHGDALKTLVMTPPGNYSFNPVKINWDGLEADYTNGIMATLTFTAPDSPGIYNILVSDEGIYDGNISPVYLTIEQGHIEVISDTPEKITAENIGVFYSDDNYEGPSKVSTAFKADLSDVSGAISLTITPTIGESRTFNNITTVTDANIILGIVVSELEDDSAVGEITIE